MATRPIDTAAIEKGTGRSWTDWLAWLDGIGARDLPHREIAARIVAEGLATGWWAQSVTVAFEQQIGRRVPGQDHRGHFQVAVTRTVAGSMDDAIAAWESLVEGIDAVDGIAVSGRPRRSVTEKWRHWQVSLADGTAVAASATGKAAERSTLTVTHDKLASPDEVERWRAFWKRFLDRLAA